MADYILGSGQAGSDVMDSRRKPALALRIVTVNVPRETRMGIGKLAVEREEGKSAYSPRSHPKLRIFQAVLCAAQACGVVSRSV